MLINMPEAIESQGFLERTGANLGRTCTILRVLKQKPDLRGYRPYHHVKENRQVKKSEFQQERCGISLQYLPERKCTSKENKAFSL